MKQLVEWNLNRATELEGWIDKVLEYMREDDFGTVNAYTELDDSHTTLYGQRMVFLNVEFRSGAPEPSNERDIRESGITFKRCGRCGVLRAILKAEPYRPRWYNPGTNVVAILRNPLILRELEGMHDAVFTGDQVSRIVHHGIAPMEVMQGNEGDVSDDD